MSWRIFRRDVTRLIRVRKTWIIVIGVLITPALYAWFNINAFWDPYANTENINVAVANLDEGASSDLTGSLNVGDQVSKQLEENDQLGWVFMGEQEAMEEVKRGDVYAAIVIPADFSEDLLSITSGEFTQPALQYYVNEKASAIAPKITDVGASQLDRQITAAFTEQVAQAATDAVRDAGDDAESQLLTAKDNALNAFDSTSQSLASARDSITDLQNRIAASRVTLSDARDTLTDVDSTLADVQKAAGEARSIIAEAQDQVIEFADAATAAYLTGTSRTNTSTSLTRLIDTLLLYEPISTGSTPYLVSFASASSASRTSRCASGALALSSPGSMELSATNSSPCSIRSPRCAISGNSTSMTAPTAPRAASCQPPRAAGGRRATRGCTPCDQTIRC